MFLGFIQQEDTLYADILARNSSQSPVNLDSLPTYRVYGPDGLMDLGTGSLTLADSGSITGASDASPIVVTSSNHGLTTGQRIDHHRGDGQHQRQRHLHGDGGGWQSLLPERQLR